MLTGLLCMCVCVCACACSCCKQMCVTMTVHIPLCHFQAVDTVSSGPPPWRSAHLYSGGVWFGGGWGQCASSERSNRQQPKSIWSVASFHLEVTDSWFQGAPWNYWGASDQTGLVQTQQPAWFQFLPTADNWFHVSLWSFLWRLFLFVCFHAALCSSLPKACGSSQIATLKSSSHFEE